MAQAQAINMATLTSGTTTTTPTNDSSMGCNPDATSVKECSGTPEDFGDLSPFVVVARDDRHCDDDLRARYDAEIDIPRPCTHSEVVRHRAAKSAAGRRRTELESSEEATRPFSRLNRARTAHLLMAREQRSQREVEKAQNASLDERGIDETLTKEIQGLNVLEQVRHPRLQAIPLLSRLASSAGSKQGRSRREMARITNTFGFVEDNDHRAAAISVQGEALDDAWVALLGSTLETNHHVRSVLLNRNSIGDKGVALLARSLRINSSVETLSLGGNRVTDEGARSFAGLLKSGCSSLKALNLAGATVPPASIMQSGSGVQDHLADACIRAPGAAALALALGDPATYRGCYLLNLNLAHQRVWDAGAIALAAALRRPACHLEALGLSGTRLTDAAAEAFSRTLKEGKCGERGGGGAGRVQQRRLQEKIEAGACGRESFICDEEEEEEEEEEGGARAGGRAAAACSLRRLDLSRNSVTDSGARYLAIGLQESNRIATSRPPHADGNGNAGNGTGARVQGSAQSLPLGTATTTADAAGLMGLDLAFNSIGFTGIAALHHALTTAATGMVFLELRANKDAGHANDGNGSSTNNSNSDTESTNKRRIQSSSNNGTATKCCSSPPPFTTDTTANAAAADKLLKEIEAVCEERRQVLRRWQLDLLRRTSTAVASSRATSSSSRPPPTQAPRNTKTQRRSTPDNREEGSGSGSGRHRRPRVAGTANSSGGDPAGGREGDVPRLPGCENSAAKPRPLEGALPTRGYYVSPLLDSCFDLLMLREPVGDPGDLRLYINRTRDKLEQRRSIREQQRQEQQRGGGPGAGDGQGRGVVSGVPMAAAAAAAAAGKNAVVGRGKLQGELKKRHMASPLAIHLEREKILAERRRLFFEDSDFAARKNARIAGGRRQNQVSRSKVLTQKHTNTAFTRELLASASGVAGMKCPRGLRAHYMGLQNFEYDWGVGSLKG